MAGISPMTHFNFCDGADARFGMLAGSCASQVLYGFLQGAWPFGLIEAIWVLVAMPRVAPRAMPSGLSAGALIAWHGLGTCAKTPCRERMAKRTARATGLCMSKRT